MLGYALLYPDCSQARREAPLTPMKPGHRKHLRFDTPMGPMLGLADDTGLCGLYFDDQTDCPEMGDSVQSPSDPVLRQACDEMRGYFAGKLTAFSIPLSPAASSFQQRVRDALLEVPVSRTTTYGSLARAIGSPKGFRAVAQALARNPIIIIVPCHRVLASDGSLGGFSAGLQRKPALLSHEALHWPEGQSQLSTSSRMRARTDAT